MDDVVQRVDLFQLVASRGLRQHVDDDLPDREVVKVRRNLRVWGEEPREEVAWVDTVLHLFLHPRDRTCDNREVVVLVVPLLVKRVQFTSKCDASLCTTKQVTRAKHVGTVLVHGLN